MGLFVRFGTSACAQGHSFKDVVVSSDPPADEEEGPDFNELDDGFPNPINFFDAYSWRLFIALNWPAKSGQRGVPDTSKDIADTTAPRVWETWKSVAEVILPGGTLPSEWNSFDGAPVCLDQKEGPNNTGRNMAFAMVGPVLEDFNQVDDTGFAVGSLVAQNRTYVRYEIRINRKEFDTIRNEKLYLREELKRRQALVEAISFDSQAIEVKAAWREFKLPAENALLSRYYHIEARAVNSETNSCETKTFGLVGFHIAQKTEKRTQWIWSTFEHTDNLTVGPGAPVGTLPTLKEAPSGVKPSEPDGGVTSQHRPKTDPDPTLVRRLPEDAIPVLTGKTNSKWRSNPRIKDTVWSNYQLVMTQWPTEQKAPTTIGDPAPGRPFPPNNVANITLETYPTLQTSSCIVCHAQAAFHTDFAWFLGLRATEEASPMINKLKKAAKRANAFHK